VRTARKIGLVMLAVATTLVTFGTAVSTAKDPYVGQTYAVASGKISEKGGKPVIATVVGDQLATADCIVTSWRKATYARDDNFDHDKNYFFSLNCSAKLAQPGAPGNSLASPEGQAEKKVEERAALYNAKPQRCVQNLETCRRFCDRNASLCSKEVLALL